MKPFDMGEGNKVTDVKKEGEIYIVHGHNNQNQPRSIQVHPDGSIKNYLGNLNLGYVEQQMAKNLEAIFKLAEISLPKPQQQREIGVSSEIPVSKQQQKKSGVSSEVPVFEPKQQREIGVSSEIPVSKQQQKKSVVSSEVPVSEQKQQKKSVVSSKQESSWKGWDACKKASDGFFSTLFKFIVRNLGLEKEPAKKAEAQNEEKDANKFKPH